MARYWYKLKISHIVLHMHMTHVCGRLTWGWCSGRCLDTTGRSGKRRVSEHYLPLPPLPARTPGARTLPTEAPWTRDRHCSPVSPSHLPRPTERWTRVDGLQPPSLHTRSKTTDWAGAPWKRGSRARLGPTVMTSWVCCRRAGEARAFRWPESVAESAVSVHLEACRVKSGFVS